MSVEDPRPFRSTRVVRTQLVKELFGDPDASTFPVTDPNCECKYCSFCVARKKDSDVATGWVDGWVT